jgi:hypothetical protein
MSSWRDKLRQRAAQNRREIINAKLSRRDLCKLGLLTAGGTLILNGTSPWFWHKALILHDSTPKM